MRVGVSAAAAVTVFLIAAVPGRAQVPPPQISPQQIPPQQIPPQAPLSPSGPGFVSPYEITRTVRAAGFNPLAPPLREGTTYVFRAIDFRHTLMRVVVDARSGAIRDATPIVSGPGPYGGVGMVASPYGEPPPYYGRPPYGAPPPYGVVRGEPNADDYALDEPSFVPARPSLQRPVTPATVTIFPPLPRPRPAELAAQRPADAKKPDTAPGDPSAIKIDAKPPAAPSEAVPRANTDVTNVPAAPAPAKPGKAPPGPPIND
jgi:hypothetical protein